MNFFTSSISELGKAIAHKATNSPEFWLFQTGNSHKTLDRYTQKVPLPQQLIELLTVLNGGFASLNGKVDAKDPVDFHKAKEQSNYFLSLPEITALYQQMDEDFFLHHLQHFPVIPFFISKKSTFFALSIQDPRAPVYILHDPEDIQTWRKVYVSLDSFLYHYIEEHGDLSIEHHDNAPSFTWPPLTNPT